MVQRVLCVACDERQGRIVHVRDRAHDPWAAITEPLPAGLYNLGALKRLRPIVYAVIHAFTWSLDDSLGLIGRLAEIDRRIAQIERQSP